MLPDIDRQELQQKARISFPWGDFPRLCIVFNTRARRWVSSSLVRLFSYHTSHLCFLLILVYRWQRTVETVGRQYAFIKFGILYTRTSLKNSNFVSLCSLTQTRPYKRSDESTPIRIPQRTWSVSTTIFRVSTMSWGRLSMMCLTEEINLTVATLRTLHSNYVTKNYLWTDFSRTPCPSLYNRCRCVRDVQKLGKRIQAVQVGRKETFCDGNLLVAKYSSSNFFSCKRKFFNTTTLLHFM